MNIIPRLISGNPDGSVQGMRCGLYGRGNGAGFHAVTFRGVSAVKSVGVLFEVGSNFYFVTFFAKYCYPASMILSKNKKIGSLCYKPEGRGFSSR
jgi:hypothetical protein